MKTNDQEGTIMLSKRRVDAQKGWEELKEKAESQEVLSGKVTEAVKGGVIVLYNGSRIFIPASQATATREESLEDLVGQEVDFRLIEVSQNGRRRRAIGSIRSVLKEQRAAQREEFWKTCEVGKRYKGVVKSLTSYGAFVDLGGVFGMIHISELSWTHSLSDRRQKNCMQKNRAQALLKTLYFPKMRTQILPCRCCHFLQTNKRQGQSDCIHHTHGFCTHRGV